MKRPESLIAQTRRVLRRYGIRARKGLGQHFLIDEDALGTIASAAGLTATDVVIEIGPGLGGLTVELARRAGRVIAVELDSNMAAILRDRLASFDNITIINEDILRIDPAALFRDQNAGLPPGKDNPFPYKVVANLPYYIASAVVRYFLEASIKPQIMVVMVQKEVAEEIVARPGRMSLLSISVQLYGEPSIVDYVPARSFYPAPEVDSAILKINVYPQPAVPISDIEGFFGLVRAGFSASRKQIANSLAQGLGKGKDEVIALLEGAGIAPQRRAETLALEEWAQLWRIFAGSFD